MSYKGNSLIWTMGRQLASYGNNTYTYNEEGIRTSKTVGGVVTKYYLDGSDIIEQTNNSATLYFFYDSNDEIVGFESGNADYFYVKNAQKDIVAIADSTGEVIAEYTYDPWGAVTSVTGSNTTIGNLNPFRYRSYYYDTEIGMYYLQSRYYDPETSRFINSDDVNYIGVTESEVSYNPFAYCENDPVNGVDYTGFWKKSFSVDWIAIPIDVIMLAICPSFSWPYDIVGNTVSYIVKRSGCKNAAKFLLTSVVPKFKGLLSRGFTLIRTAIWRLTGSIISNFTTGIVSRVFEKIVYVLNRPWLSQLYYFVSSFFSVGAFIAGFLDYMTDGVYNGRIVLRG